MCPCACHSLTLPETAPTVFFRARVFPRQASHRHRKRRAKTSLTESMKNFLKTQWGAMSPVVLGALAKMRVHTAEGRVEENPEPLPRNWKFTDAELSTHGNIEGPSEQSKEARNDGKEEHSELRPPRWTKKDLQGREQLEGSDRRIMAGHDVCDSSGAARNVDNIHCCLHSVLNHTLVFSVVCCPNSLGTCTPIISDLSVAI